MMDLDLTTEDFQVVEIKRNISLALVRTKNGLRYTHRDNIPIARRRQYYEERKDTSLDGQS